jgi:hypothetical protein
MGHHYPAEDVMTTWPIAQPDLFQGVPYQTEWAPAQRKKAVTLLQVLLIEAIGASAGPCDAPETPEAGDDKNHG